MQDHTTNPSSAVSRRQFLMHSTIIAASAAAVSFPTVLRAQNKQSINAVIIGLGGRGSGAGRDFMEAAKAAGVDGKIVGVADIFPESAKKGMDNFGLPEAKCFSGFDAFQKALALPGVNYAILATPPGFRAAHFKAAIEAGKHKVGPSLHGVVGRQAGSTDFARYVGLKGTDIVWTEENLFEYLADPTAFVKSKTQNPRSGMAYKLPKPEERADVIAYLKTLTN